MTSMKNAVVISTLSMTALATVAVRTQQRDPQSYHFTVTGVGEAGELHNLGSWSTVSGLDVTWDLAEYRSGGAANADRWYFPGNTKYGAVNLHRASSDDTDSVLAWLNRIGETGDSPTLVITLLDQAGDPVVTWQLVDVWPTKYTVGGENAEGTDVAMETLVLSYERLDIICERAC